MTQKHSGVATATTPTTGATFEIEGTGSTADNFVISRDGTRISYLSTGSGPAVVLIPGALSVAATYMDFAQALGNDYSVHVIERRGRGLSGPQGDDYSILRECEDVQALAQKTGATFLVGHSYGGLVALETARNNPDLHKIAVYEPGVSIDGLIPMGWMPAYEKYLSEKKYSDALAKFIIGAGPDRARMIPHWPPQWFMKMLVPVVISSHQHNIMLSLLAESLREHREVARLDNSYRNYAEVAADVLLMYGGKTGMRWVDKSMKMLAEVLPHSTTKQFPAGDHFAIDQKAPREVAEAVSAYFAM